MLPYHDTRPEPPGWSPLRVMLITTLVLTLGFGGAVFGIHVANVNEAAPDPTTSPTAGESPTPTAAPTTAPPTTAPPSPSPTPTVTTLPPGEFLLPVLTGMRFEDARDEVRELGLQWRLSFGGLGNDRTVVATWPLPGATVRSGDQVRIFVVGTAPVVEAPDILGEECADAAELVVDAGLYPRLQTEDRDGRVVEAADHAELRWNDELAFTCSG